MKNTKQPVNPALILIDIQQGFDVPEWWGTGRNNADAEENARLLLEHWRLKGWAVFHVKHNSVKPGSPLAPTHPGNAIKKEVAPLAGEPVIGKTVNSAFIGTDLQQRLDEAGITTVVIAGLVTPHCVSTTARMAGNLGFRTYVSSDATAAFPSTTLSGEPISAETVHEVSLATVNHEFATVLSTQQLLETFSLLSLEQEILESEQG